MQNSDDRRNVSDLTSLDDFLEEEGVSEEVTAHAIKRIIALQLQGRMKDRHLTKKDMAEQMRTSRAQLDRVLDPDNFNVTLDTLFRAARIVGSNLRVVLD
jgi:antitoxin HicB